jgi:hypothetical protein
MRKLLNCESNEKSQCKKNNPWALYNAKTWQPENEKVQPLKKKHTQGCANTGIEFIKGLRGLNV